MLGHTTGHVGPWPPQHHADTSGTPTHSTQHTQTHARVHTTGPLGCATAARQASPSSRLITCPHSGVHAPPAPAWHSH